MANVLGRRALYTDTRQAKHTVVSLGGNLEKRQNETSFQNISAGGFLYKSGIREGDRLISVNFFPTKDVPFEQLIETICVLTPLALGVERTSDDGTVVAIVVVMEILADKDREPKLKFHGFYFWKDVEKLDKIIKYIPIHIELMDRYHYDSKESNVIFIDSHDNNQFLLTVDDTFIKFRDSDTNKAVFTMYKYNSLIGREQVIILAPQENSSQCLAASSSDLTLKSFKETYWTDRRRIYTPNERFLVLVNEKSDNLYKLESSTEKGYYVTRTDNNMACMSQRGTLLHQNEILNASNRDTPVPKSRKRNPRPRRENNAN